MVTLAIAEANESRSMADLSLSDRQVTMWDFDGVAGRRIDSTELNKSLADVGFVVVRSLLEPEEVIRARSAVLRHLRRSGSRLGLGKSQPNAAVVVSDLAFLFAHERIIDVYRAILGKGNIVFTGHADVHMNMLSGWHKDSGEAFGGYFRGDYFHAEACRVYKTAVYLQDSDDRTGLTLRAGSHRSAQLGFGEAIEPSLRAGDVVVFDVRLDHTGQLPDCVEKGIKALNSLLIGRDRIKEDARIASAARALYWRVRKRRDRLSVFFTFGYPNAYTYDFAVRNAIRQNRQSHQRGTELPLPLKHRLEALGVSAYDPTTHECWPASALL